LPTKEQIKIEKYLDYLNEKWCQEVAEEGMEGWNWDNGSAGKQWNPNRISPPMTLLELLQFEEDQDDWEDRD